MDGKSKLIDESRRGVFETILFISLLRLSFPFSGENNLKHVLMFE